MWLMRLLVAVFSVCLSFGAVLVESYVCYTDMFETSPAVCIGISRL